MNKRGQGLSINAIFLIILGVIILVVLAIGFFAGWNTFGDLFGGGSNVDTLAKSCNIACSTSAKFDFCTQMRELKIDEVTDTSLTGVENGGTYTCKDLFDKAPTLGIANCPGLCS